MHFTETCADCSCPPDGPDGFCGLHRAIYNGERPFSDDICRCRTCTSDMVGIVPCMKETER
jgi:hypothetical protein